jgi:hypothetical protein
MYIGRGEGVAILGVCATVAITVIAIGRAYVQGLEVTRRDKPRELSPDVEARMSRIEQAVDAIAIEVERMSEGQRYTTRLLSEQFGDHGRSGTNASLQPSRRTPDPMNRAGGANAH